MVILLYVSSELDDAFIISMHFISMGSILLQTSSVESTDELHLIQLGDQAFLWHFYE